MQERTIMYTALVVTVIGFIVLALAAELNQTIDMEKINQGFQPSQRIEMQGVVQSVRKHDKVWFVELEGQKTETVNAVLFPKEDIYLQEGDIVQLWGTIEQYKGEEEVLASRILLTHRINTAAQASGEEAEPEG